MGRSGSPAAGSGASSIFSATGHFRKQKHHWKPYGKTLFINADRARALGHFLKPKNGTWNMSDEDDISESDMLRLQSATAIDPQQSFNVNCNRLFLQGAKDFDDFEDAVGRLKENNVTSNDVLMQLMECDQPTKIMHQLAGDLELAKQVRDLPPVKRAAALAAIERGEPIPEAKSPAWKTPASKRHEDLLDDATWSRLYNQGKLPSQLNSRRGGRF